MKLAWFIISIIPMPFIFSYVDSLQSGFNYSLIAVVGYVILAGFLSTKVHPLTILFMSAVPIVISLYLAPIYIIPPNESWFNPFTMNGWIVFLGILILVGTFIIRYFSIRWRGTL